MKKIRVFTAFICVAAVLTLSSCFSLNVPDPGKIQDPNEATTTIVMNGETDYSYTYQETTAPYEDIPTVIPEITTAPAVQEIPSAVIPEEPATEPEKPSENTAPDYSSYTKKQILDMYGEALNKTRSYTGSLSAVVTEAFNADIKDAHPGGQLTELLASNIVKLVGSEGSQTLNFSNGKATNKDGESVPVLLPQRTSFSLPEEGVKNAVITDENGKTRIRITLVPETVAMGEIPKFNSGAVGYLDTSDMNFVIITISRVDISYTGSVIDAVINRDGYIESVNYTINMSTYAELSGMGITGYGTLEGAQTENWKLNY